MMALGRPSKASAAAATSAYTADTATDARKQHQRQEQRPVGRGGGRGFRGRIEQFDTDRVGLGLHLAAQLLQFGLQALQLLPDGAATYPKLRPQGFTGMESTVL